MKKNISEIQLTSIGFISKPSGFNGEMILALNAGEPDDYKNVRYIFIEIEGKPVPFFVEEIKSHRNDVIVRFEDVNSESEAKKLSGKNICINKSDAAITDETVEWNLLVGYHIYETTHGSLGLLERIEEFPQQLIAHCRVNGKEVLFPLNEDFILKIDDSKKELHLNLPEGLLDVYLQ